MLIVGETGKIFRYEGEATAKLDLDAAASQTAINGAFNDIWAASASEVYVVGDGGVVVYYDGASWEQLADVGTKEDLNAVWGTDSGELFVVGAAGTILHFDGERWSPKASVTTDDLVDVWGVAPDEVFAAAFGGEVLRYDGAAWRIFR
jgi:photosystem II stability/assembly factor-like uncharacterized protein